MLNLYTNHSVFCVDITLAQKNSNCFLWKTSINQPIILRNYKLEIFQGCLNQKLHNCGGRFDWKTTAFDFCSKILNVLIFLKKVINFDSSQFSTRISQVTAILISFIKVSNKNFPIKLELPITTHNFFHSCTGFFMVRKNQKGYIFSFLLVVKLIFFCC